MSACSFWLLKKAGKQRRKSITNLSSGHIARCILHGITAYCETDSSSGSGLPSVVDRSSAEGKSSMNPRQTVFENPQAYGAYVKANNVIEVPDDYDPLKQAIKNAARGGAH